MLRVLSKATRFTKVKTVRVAQLSNYVQKPKVTVRLHWNTVFEEMKAKAKTALECEEKQLSTLDEKSRWKVCSATSRAIGRSVDFYYGAWKRSTPNSELWPWHTIS